jgi:short-subunit dehydrogenase
VQLEGKVAVVTGASRGIGRATALALAEHDVRLLLVGRDRAALDEVARDTGASVHVADVARPDHAAAVVRAAGQAYGRLDIVVANAGIGHSGPFADMCPEQIDKLIAVNIRGPALIANAALPGMLEQRCGSVVLLGSIAGVLPVPGETLYATTKAALEAFAEALREEVWMRGVHVCTVVPGAVRTQFFESRGVPYGRRFPRPIAADKVAAAVITAIENERDRVIVPSWLHAPVRLHRIAPGVYRFLARRFG